YSLSPLQTSQLGFCSLSPTYSRVEIVDLTHATYTETLTYLTLKPKTKTRDWIFTSVFSPPIWVEILLSAMFLNLIIYWWNRFLPKVFLNFRDVSEILGAILLRQSK